MATITKRGDRWRVQIRRRGAKPLSAAFETKARAQAWATQQEAEILAGKRGEYIRRPLMKALEKYEAEVSISKAGHRWEKIRIGAFKRARIAQKAIHEVTEADVAEWRDERLKAVSGVTVRREMALWGAIFDVARREWKWCATNPVADVTKPKPAAARRRGVAADEVDRVLAQLNGVLGKQVATAFQLAIETGMRKGEMLSLTWDQVRGSVVRLTTTKNGEARDVALSRQAIALLDSLRGLDPVRVFTVQPETADALFRKAVKAAKVEDLHFHDSRSEAITRLSRKLDVLELAKQVGHRDLKSLMHYYAPSAAERATKLD